MPFGARLKRNVAWVKLFAVASAAKLEYKKPRPRLPGPYAADKTQFALSLGLAGSSALLVNICCNMG